MSTLSDLQADAQIAEERIQILETLRQERPLTPEEKRLLSIHQEIVLRWLAQYGERTE